MKSNTAKWIGEIVLAVVAAYFGFFIFVYAYAGIGAMSWNPGLYQMHPLVFGASVLGGIALLYLAYIALKSAKRGGEWRWR
jgi:uncharacterized membrane protein